MIKLKKGLPFVLPIVVYAFPAIFLYAKNVKEANIADMLPSMLALLGIGYAIFVVALCVYRRILPAALFSAIFGLVILNYDIFERASHKLLPFMRVWQVAPIIAVFIGLAIALMYQKARGAAEFISVLLSLCFTALIVLNLVTALPTELSKISLHSADANISQGEGLNNGDKTNIYYILLDEYASFDQCRNALGYDNKQMESFLTKNKFNISYSSANDHPATDIVMANVFALDYLANDDTTATQLSEYKQNGALHARLEQCGYTKRGIGDTQWLGIKSESVSDGAKGPTADSGEGFWDLLTKNMLFGKSVSFIDTRQVTGEAAALLDSMAAFDTFEIHPNSSEFVMMYLACPHHPFYFGKDGTLNAPSDYFNYEGDNVDSYIGQLQYVTTRVTAAIERILAKDKNSIIMLFSDHGLRFGNAEQKAEQKKILNTVYYRGEVLDELEGKSTLNTMILMLNKEHGLDLEYKPLP